MFKLIRRTANNSVSETASATTTLDYYHQAADWHYQIYENQKVWLNRALIGIGLLTILLIVAIIAIAVLTPLKQNIPFLYTLNETTGELTQLGQFQVETFKENWLMTRFLIVRYVVNRESYNADNLNRPYQIAWAMADASIADEYARAVQTDNPTSPYATYGKNKFITVHVLSVNQLNENTAEIRFDQTLHERDTDKKTVIQKAAIIKWHYNQPETTQKMLDRDPLGFKVSYYQPTQVNLDK